MGVRWVSKPDAGIGCSAFLRITHHHLHLGHVPDAQVAIKHFLLGWEHLLSLRRSCRTEEATAR